MKNEKTYVIKIDYPNSAICNEDYESVITALLSGNTPFRVLLIDKTGIIDSHINLVTNKYIADCISSMGKKVLIESGAAYIKNFIIGFMRLSSEQSEESEEFEVVNKTKYFKVYIPKTYVDDKKRQDFLHLRRGYSITSFSKEVIETYIKPRFYLFLFRNDLLDDSEYNDLTEYEIGLA